MLLLVLRVSKVPALITQLLVSAHLIHMQRVGRMLLGSDAM